MGAFQQKKVKLDRRAGAAVPRQKGTEMEKVVIPCERWTNEACLGYAIMAMERQNLSRQQIQVVVDAMSRCFDQFTIKEAIKHYCGSVY